MAVESCESDQEQLTDRALVDQLRREGSCTIQDLVDYAGVTATAIRQRLNRLMEQGLVERVAERAGRGRPTYRYSLSRAGRKSAGDNYEDLALALWAEIRGVEDGALRKRLMGNVVRKLAEAYANRIEGSGLHERMESLVRLLSERDVPFEVSDEGAELPVLTALACPYPDLAEQDRSVCLLEKLLFTELLGNSLRLGNCRLDGSTCCTFEISPTSTL